MTDARMVLGFSGWMDGGDVSTGTIEYLIEALGAEPLAEMAPEHFYIYSFPGSMEISALFRPHTVIEEGLLRRYEPPANVFHCHSASNLVLFAGKEPNFHWADYAECLLSLAEEMNVSEITFVGSVAGLVPHTREPRLFASVSEERVKDRLEPYSVRFSDYEGPASIVTYLLDQAGRRALPMASLVGEIPAYVQGRNPRCIEAMVRRLSAMLGLRLDLDDLRADSDAFERKLSRVVRKKDDLAKLIGKLEADYDNEVFDSQMGDLKEWLQEKGIRLD